MIEYEVTSQKEASSISDADVARSRFVDEFIQDVRLASVSPILAASRLALTLPELLPAKETLLPRFLQEKLEESRKRQVEVKASIGWKALHPANVRDTYLKFVCWDTQYSSRVGSLFGLDRLTILEGKTTDGKFSAKLIDRDGTELVIEHGESITVKFKDGTKIKIGKDLRFEEILKTNGDRLKFSSEGNQKIDVLQKDGTFRELKYEDWMGLDCDWIERYHCQKSGIIAKATEYNLSDNSKR